MKTEDLIKQAEIDLAGKSTSDLIAMANQEMGGTPAPSGGVGGYLKETASNIPSSAYRQLENIGAAVKQAIQPKEIIKNAVFPYAMGVTADEFVNPSNLMDRYGAGKIWKVAVERYGSMDKALETIKTDPVGFASDISMLLTGAGGAAKGAGLNKIGRGLTKAGAISDPINVVTETGKGLARTLVPSSVPDKLYASSLKMGTGKKLTSSERANRISTGLENEILPTEVGIEKGYSIVDSIDNRISTAIKEGAKQGKKVNVDKVVSYLDNLKEEFKMQANPADDLAAIDSAIEGFKKYHGGAGEIPIDVAQKIKSGTYKQLRGKYGKLGTAAIESEKNLARGLKEEIYGSVVDKYPELKALGTSEGAMLSLLDSVENAYKRIQNRDIIGLGSTAKTAGGQVIAGAPGAVAGTVLSILDMPVPKAKLAILLNRARKTKMWEKPHTGLQSTRLIGEALNKEEQP